MAAIKYLTVQNLSQTKFIDQVRGWKLLRWVAYIKIHKEADKREDENCRYKVECTSFIIKLQLVLFKEKKEGHKLCWAQFRLRKREKWVKDACVRDKRTTDNKKFQEERKSERNLRWNKKF